MTNRIFTFTGTGNAFAIARRLADGLGDTEVLRMSPRAPDVTGVERIGLVFPVFGWGMPRMAMEFVRSLRVGPGQYVFAVATCAGSHAKTLVQTRKSLRAGGSDLHAGFAVLGEFHISFPGSKPLAIIRLMSWLSRNDRPALFAERADEIIEAVVEKRSHAVETTGPLANMLGALVNGAARESFRKADRAFASTDACVSCGICERVCPRENVTLEGGRPAWHHDCEFCYACVAWCPRNAITLGGCAPEAPAHHPDVTVDDVVWR